MTGFYVRLPDGQGKWRSVEIEQLADQELANWILSLNEKESKMWVISLVRWIRENVKEQPGSDPEKATGKDERNAFIQ